MQFFPISVILILALAGCASTSVTPVSKNQIIISTSAAPACGTSGAAEVASKMAAIESIRRGYERYIISVADSQNNVGVLQTGPTYATTTSNTTGLGNRAYGNSKTTFGGQQTILTGTNDAMLAVTMFNRGEPGFDNAIDARTQLGTDWQELVTNGVSTCS